MEARQRADGVWEVQTGPDEWWPAASWYIAFTRFEPPDESYTDLSIADMLMMEGWTPPPPVNSPGSA